MSEYARHAFYAIDNYNNVYRVHGFRESRPRQRESQA